MADTQVLAATYKKIKQEFTGMNNRKRTQKLSSMKLIYLTLLTILLLSSCEQNSNKKASLNEELIDIYKMEIKMKLEDAKRLTEINPIKFKESYYEAKEIQSKFDSIYSLIEKNDLNINPLLKVIYDQTKKHYTYNTAKKIEIVLNANTTNIDSKELQTILLDLNSIIISQIQSDVDILDFKFNKICVVVLPEERVIKLGDTYKAYALIGAVDSTAIPTFTYENQSKQIKSTYGSIQIKSEKRGKFKSKGEMKLISNHDGTIYRFPFKFNYEVK